MCIVTIPAFDPHPFPVRFLWPHLTRPAYLAADCTGRIHERVDPADLARTIERANRRTLEAHVACTG